MPPLFAFDNRDNSTFSFSYCSIGYVDDLLIKAVEKNLIDKNQ